MLNYVLAIWFNQRLKKTFKPVLKWKKSGAVLLRDNAKPPYNPIHCPSKAGNQCSPKRSLSVREEKGRAPISHSTS